MTNLRFLFIFGVCAGLLFLAACATSPKPPTASAPTTAPIATSKPSPTPTSTPGRNPQPTFTLVPPSPTPTATRIACNLDSPYLGVSHPGNAIYLIDIVDGCVAGIMPGNLTKANSWGSWLPDSSGTEPSSIYWVDLQSGELTRVFSDEFEKRSPILFGITPDNKYIVLLDGQYQTWLFDTQTEQLTQLPMEIYDTIEWRP